MAKKTTRKKNPADSTLRNVQAANKRFKDLEDRVTQLEAENEERKTARVNALERPPDADA